MRTPAKAKDNTAAEARVRMYIRRDLAWLDGFPGEQNHWLVAPLGDSVTHVPLSRDLLHRSARTINMLVREFPRALPRVVGDVELWASRRKALMELAKRNVHAGEPLPLAPTDAHPLASPALKKKIAGARAKLRRLSSLAAAFEWSGWTDPGGVVASLAWLHEHEVQLSAITSQSEDSCDILCFRLWQLTRDHGAKRVAPILSFLAQPELWTVPLECRRQYLHAHSAWATKRKSAPDSAPPAPLEARLPALVMDWVLWLATQDARTQRKGLGLFPTLVEGCDASHWGSWWKRFEGLTKEASRIPDMKKGKDRHKKARQALVERFTQLGKEKPPTLPAKMLAGLLRSLPSQEQDGLWKSLDRLEHWPAIHEGAAIRIALCDRWLGIWRDSSSSNRAALLRLVAEFHSYARDVSFTPDALLPWSGVWGLLQGRTDYSGLDYTIRDELRSGEQLANFFRILRESPGTTSDQAELLVKLCATFPAETVGKAYVALRNTSVAGRYIPEGVLNFAATMASKRPARLPMLMDALLEHEIPYGEIGPSLIALDRLFASDGFPDLVLGEIEEGRLSLLATVAFERNLILREGGTVPEVPTCADSPRPWAQRYPAELQAALARLARYDEDAAKTARRILAKDFPDPAALRRELASLERVESSDGENDAAKEKRRRRALNLRSRLDSPTSPSNRRLARLLAKLSATTEQKALHGWLSALDDAYQGVVRSYLDIEAAPDWLQDARVARSLGPMAELDHAFQSLGKTLLRARAGAPPWDLREHPRNRTFLDKMERQGIRSDVWLDERNVAATASDGRALSLSLEQDPLEIFHMGGHFKTCLSPGAFNYFSTIANAADINKRVLFARDSEGRVFGRQLLALTDEGGLLAFHCYAHSQRVGFLDIAKEYVTKLAEDMGTLVVAAGRVSTLVAPRWYDDGPIDFASEHAALKEGSRFRRSLKTLEARHFLQATSDALAPLPLNELTLPRILALPELSERPELLVLLLPLAKQSTLSLTALVAFVDLLIKAGDLNTDFAAKWVHEAALREVNVHDHWTFTAVELLVRIAPTRALDVLKRTRDKEVRRWSDDWDSWRLRLVALAYESLHRRNKAMEFWQLAVNANASTPFRREYEDAMKRLRGPVST